MAARGSRRLTRLHVDPNYPFVMSSLEHSVGLLARGGTCAKKLGGQDY